MKFNFEYVANLIGGKAWCMLYILRYHVKSLYYSLLVKSLFYSWTKCSAATRNCQNFLNGWKVQYFHFTIVDVHWKFYIIHIGNFRSKNGLGLFLSLMSHQTRYCDGHRRQVSWVSAIAYSHSINLMIFGASKCFYLYSYHLSR